MTIIFTMENMRLLTLFENLTNIRVKDCFVNNDTIYYVVEQGKIGLAIGKGGSSIRNIEKIVGKKIKVYEYSPDPIKFIKNLIPQAKDVKIIEKNDGTEAEIRVDKVDRGFVIGRNGEKIKVYKEILKRVHNISDLRVR